MPAETLFAQRSEPYATHMIDVGAGHRIFVEECGRRDGLPVVFLHGGPGSGSQPHHRALFDPGRFRAVLFDQRGAGRSTPWLGLAHNTTADLVADMERIRLALGIARWMLVGGSWGSALAAAYAEAHPERVLAIVMRAVFLGTDEEAHWAFVDGPRRFRPELHERFLAFLPPRERADPLPAYYARLLSPDAAIQVPAAWVWHHYERALSELRTGGSIPPEPRAIGKPPPTAVMEAHYLSNSCFLAPGALIGGAKALAGIPGHIVQGRYDLLCPPQSAAALNRAWPGSTLEVIDAAGHAMSEPGVTEALIAAIGRLAASLKA